MMDGLFSSSIIGRFWGKDCDSIDSMVRREFIYNVLYDNISSIFDIDKYRKVLNIVHFPNVALLIQVDTLKGEEKRKDELKRKRNILFNKFNNYLNHGDDGLIAIIGRNNINTAIAGQKEVIVLLPVDTGGEKEKQTLLSKRYARHLKAIMEKEIDFTVSIGIGNTCRDVRKLSLSYREAREALEYKFYTGNSSIIHYQDMDISKRGNLRFFIETESKLVQAIRKNDIQEVQCSIERVFGFVRERCRVSPEIFRIRVMEMLTVISRTAVELGVNSERMLALKVKAEREIKQQSTLEEMQDWLFAMVNEIITAIGNIQQDNTVKLINKAKRYLEENYYKNVSLEEVAEHISISPYYLSHVFKEATGISFINYLTQLRINNAQNMLMSTDMPISEVGYRVGYKDPNYFSRIFKKITGRTPLQYREGRKA